MVKVYLVLALPITSMWNCLPWNLPIAESGMRMTSIPYRTRPNCYQMLSIKQNVIQGPFAPQKGPLWWSKLRQGLNHVLPMLSLIGPSYCKVDLKCQRWIPKVLGRVSGVYGRPYTALQSMMNAKLSPHRFWPFHENGLVKTIQTIPHNLYVCEFQVGFPLLWIKDYPGLS